MHAGPRRGRWLRAAAAALVIALALLVLLLAGRDRFEGAVVGADGEKVYVARGSERVQARFVDREQAETAYRVDVETGATRRTLAGRTGEHGAVSRLALPSVAPPARVSVRWTVGGRAVAQWVFLVRPRKPAG
jgi:hypothetical protein